MSTPATPRSISASHTFEPFASDWGNFSESSTTRTGANGSVTFENIRFDGPDQTVWVVVSTPQGQVESNHCYREPS
ncbi:hypothetical protein [Actinokineospora sp.]|uniref:hypothetical protein n=1 Tax=Actinokineospora sp. TaxID=1872133 RepID=UPI0040382790